MNVNLNVKDHVKGSSSFVYCRQGALWYRTDTDLLFPVPLEDLGETQILATERSMLLMRYIRKYLESVSKELAS